MPQDNDMAVPNAGHQQTASLVLDVDQDGVTDFVITERTRMPAVVWYRFNGNRFDRFVIDNTHLSIEAGGDAFDIDGDGRIYFGSRLFPWNLHDIQGGSH